RRSSDLKLEVSLLVEHHQGEAGDRLRHRVDAEDRIFFHWQAAFAVALSGRLEVSDFPVPGDKGRETGDLAPVHIGLEIIGDVRKPGWIQTDILRLRDTGHDVHSV